MVDRKQKLQSLQTYVLHYFSDYLIFFKKKGTFRIDPKLHCCFLTKKNRGFQLQVRSTFHLSEF